MRRYVSVFVVILFVVKALKVIYGSEKGGYDQGFQVSVLVCFVYCAVLGRVSSRNKIPL